jgi:Glutamate dehydrogenase/leucine dehydrogenase
VHNSNLGPALGGCRMWHYATEDDAIRDVLRLSRGMTYKSALAGLKLGGGKSVIIGNPRTDKTPALLDAFARALNQLNGRYVAAEDSGTSVADMKYLAERTPHVAGIEDKPSHEAEGMRSGDPSPATAYGTFFGIKAAVRRKLGRDSLDGLRVAIQGVGNVGFDLARQLKEAGAELWVSDIHEENLVRARTELGASALAPEAIYAASVDVFAPCALGAILNDETIPQLHASIVAGAANNQLAEVRHGSALMHRGILYAPDYVINAGGIIDIYHERIGFERAALLRHVEGIHDTLLEIFERADREARPTGEVADALAEERFKR